MPSFIRSSNLPKEGKEGREEPPARWGGCKVKGRGGGEGGCRDFGVEAKMRGSGKPRNRTMFAPQGVPLEKANLRVLGSLGRTAEEERLGEE